MAVKAKFWKFTFERFCFDFQPAIRQTAEVVFQTKLPLNDETSGEFEDLAWQALSKQYPNWTEGESSRSNFTFRVSRKKYGWSSALFAKGFEFIEVKEQR